MAASVILDAFLASLTIFSSFLGISRGEGTLTDVDMFDFDGLPGGSFEFRVDIPPGKEECFYQSIPHGAEIHVSFEVLRGADRNVDLVIKRPDHTIIDSHLWTNEGTTDKTIDMAGDHSICIDNSFSRFSHKLVYVYVVIFKPEDWEDFVKGVEDFESSAGNMTDVLGRVQKTITDMLKMQAISRKHHIADWYIARNNQTHIQRWSIVMLCVIVFTYVVQVIFVRRLFSSKNVVSSKPRA